MTPEPIPFLDLITPHRELEAELLRVVQQAFRTAGFIGGPVLEEFERAFAEFCSAHYCVGVSSGTDALRFAIMAAGIGTGDAIITVPNTFIATTEAITQAGALPEFVDIDERTYNIDLNKLREYLEFRSSWDTKTGRLISRRTGRRLAAIIPVHLYGQMADMDPILALAENHNLVVIEDACQAHGAEYFSETQNRWCKAGSMGHAAAFSFYPGKNLGACGEAGAVTTNDEELARRLQMLRDHGQAKKYFHAFEGYNGRLDSIQAGILRIKLKHLAGWNEKRRLSASLYAQLFASDTQQPAPDTLHSTLDPIVPPYEPLWVKAVYHLYVVRVQERERLQAYLSEHGISTGLHYPVPLHLQKAYENRGFHQGDFPVTERIAKEIISLPMFPDLTVEQQQRVVATVKEFYSMNTNVF